MEARVSAYDYQHPPEAIAQVPAVRREGARLLFVQRGRPGVLADGVIPDLVAALASGDLLVVNETRVLSARLTARRSTGGRVSVLVLEPREREASVLLGARGRLAVGERLDVHGDTWRIDAILGGGRFAVSVEAGRPVAELVLALGRMPLPPYIERGDEIDDRDGLDRERYQTTFARSDEQGGHAVAAPTAGLHLTPALLAELEVRGVRVGRLSLDVGLGTFQPLRGETLDEHVMHAERYEVGPVLAGQFAATRAAGGRVVAVGTTVVRTLETVVAPDGRSLAPGAGETRLFLRPGHHFAAVDALLTNFHQPRSTLMVLVAAFAGLDTIHAAYAHAVGSGYRLFSYGDAMFLSDELPA